MQLTFFNAFEILKTDKARQFFAGQFLRFRSMAFELKPLATLILMVKLPNINHR
jgi:hypothetical protein